MLLCKMVLDPVIIFYSAMGIQDIYFIYLKGKVSCFSCQRNKATHKIRGISKFYSDNRKQGTKCKNLSLISKDLKRYFSSFEVADKRLFKVTLKSTVCTKKKFVKTKIVPRARQTHQTVKTPYLSERRKKNFWREKNS